MYLCTYSDLEQHQDIFMGHNQQSLCTSFPLQDMAYTCIMYLFKQWPWTCKTDTGSSSWHILKP